MVRAAALGPEKGVVFLDREERETSLRWPELLARAAAVAGGLRARGVRPGDTVAVVLPTGAAFFHAFFGVQLAGAVPVPLYPPVRLGRLDEYHARTAAMLTAVRARLVLAGARTWRVLGDAVARARPELGCVDVDGVTGPAVVHEARPEDLALAQFSSGTTVEPKPVALTHANVLANVSAIRDVLLEAGADSVEHGVSWLPLYHDMGLIGTVFLALCHPASLTLIPPELFVARPALWLRALSRTRATVSAAPNFAYALCTERIRDEEMEGVDLGGWRLALNGAEPVSATTLRAFVGRFARWGLRPEALTPVYGLAEATLAVTFSDWRTPFRATRFDRDALADGRAVPAANGTELVSVGQAVPGVELDAPIGTVGPIRVKGPSITPGYLHQPELTRAAIADGWLDTGDLGFLHEGELYVCGRTKDVVILRGRNYAPHDIEQAIEAMPGVRAGGVAAVSHVPQDDETERLIVFVEAQGAEPDLATRCREAVLAAMGLDPALVVVLVPGTLPRTSSGKIRRGDTLRRWIERTLMPAEKVTPRMLAGALAKGTLARWRPALAPDVSPR
ncbi:MAG: fatty acyl-AMP ligase [Candidatus Rokubacteria bacterium]|nr:fatty acyl-AMP ligase [Candidatus Rokubacteria bacterium]